MKGPFEITRKAAKPGAEKLSRFHSLGQRGIKLFVAVGTSISEAPVFDHTSQFYGELGDLMYSGRGLMFLTQRGFAARTFREAVLFDFDDLFGFKDLAPESLMSFLAAGLSGTGAFGSRWLNDIRSGWLGGCGRILGKPCDLFLEHLDLSPLFSSNLKTG